MRKGNTSDTKEKKSQDGRQLCLFQRVVETPSTARWQNGRKIKCAKPPCTRGRDVYEQRDLVLQKGGRTKLDASSNQLV